MEILYILLAVLLGLFLMALIVTYICFRLTFYYKNPGPMKADQYDIPEGRIYEPYRQLMTGWMKQLRAETCTTHTIMSHDGLRLYAKYYEYKKGAPIEIMFHGYKGNAERDLCGGVFRCFALERNVLLVDQRAGGQSEGKIVSFGINEVKDCLRWIDYAKDTFGKEVQLILTGVSMGAATVMMAAGAVLPKNVKYILADCGYTSPKEIIKKVIKQMKLPAGLLYPFVRLSGKIFGGFDIESNSPIEAVKRSTTPIIFFHGDTDDFVPCSMSEELYEECASEKELVIIKGAGHGLAYPVDQDGYLNSLREFNDRYIEAKESKR